MRHPILDQLSPLQYADDDHLEGAVDMLIAEAEQEAHYSTTPDRAVRAEALAILGHELRRRADTPKD